MALPKVAIVGRPNVGKSSLFNMLAGRRIAIVEPTAGVTRDRLATAVEFEGRYFEIIDTGGIGIHDVDNLTAEIEKQIQTAIDEAALVLFVLDVRDGLVPLDEEVARRLRGIGKPVILVANKCDIPELEPQAEEFRRLGWDELICVSAHHRRNRAELLRLVCNGLPPASEAPPLEDLKLAIVGRRNTGKSTFINSLAQAERVIVSEVPGTTRDSVDVRLERDGKTIVAIDTAGVRKKSSLANSIEFYSLARAERSIRRADVVLLFFDPTQPVSKVDKQLADYILENHKPAIFVVNKWDLMRPMPTGEWGDYLRGTFPSLDFVPIAFITAKSGKNVQTVLNLAQNLHKQAGARVPTSVLNRIVRDAVEDYTPPVRYNRQPRVFFATQADVHPPTVVLFTNGPELFDPPYLRYLTKIFRDHLPFNDVPIKLLLRERGGDGKPGERRDDSAAPEEASRPTARRPARKKKLEPSDVWRDV
jgi:GTP-binding protein